MICQDMAPSRNSRFSIGSLSDAFNRTENEQIVAKAAITNQAMRHLRGERIEKGEAGQGYYESNRTKEANR